jgi:hypothetical protein
MGIKKVSATLAPIAKECLRKGATIILSPWLPRPPGALGNDEARKRKRIVQIAAVLVVILALSFLGGSINRSRHNAAEKREKAIASIENKLTEAEKLKDVDSANAASLLSEAEEELNKLPAKDPKVARLAERVSVLSTEISRIYEVNVETFVDLSALKGKIEAKKLRIAGNFLFVLDTGTGSVYKVDVTSKKASILVSEKGDLQNIAATPDTIYTQSKDGVRRVDVQTKVEKKLAAAAAKWKKLIAADSYRGNLYLLDSEAKQIWKYMPAGEGLSGPANYFSESFNEVATSFAVDGSVWVATKNTLLKFSSGKKQTFEVKNLPQSYSEIAEVYTSEGNANLYIFDKGAGGLFIIEKSSGNYSGLYMADKLKEASSAVVDEAKKVVYVLAGNTIYTFNLK